MRIGLFTDTYKPSINGIVFVAESLKTQLESMGHEVYVFCPAKSIRPSKHADILQETDHFIRFPSVKGAFYDDYDTSLFFPPMVLRKIRQLDLDIIHVLTPGQVGLIGIQSAWKTDTPFIIQHCTDIYEFSEHYPATLPGALALVGLVVPFTVKLKGKDIRELAKLYRPRRGATVWNKDIIEKTVTVIYSKADAVIAVSDETKHQLEAIGVRRPIKVIYNMIDTSRYHFLAKDRQKSRRDLGIDPTKTVVLGNGQVQPRKRVDTFINIAKRLPDMQFIWIGGMPFGKAAASYSDMQKLVDSAPSNVKFTGVVDLEKVRQYFATGDIFVMTSDQETFGLAIIEAAASGLPVVLRDIADYDNTFRNDALVCQESEFVEAVTKLAGDRSYYEQMQAHSASIARRFDSRSVTDQLLSLYRSCLEK